MSLAFFTKSAVTFTVDIDGVQVLGSVALAANSISYNNTTVSTQSYTGSVTVSGIVGHNALTTKYLTGYTQVYNPGGLSGDVVSVVFHTINGLIYRIGDF
jgi:hypothetical protein